VRGRKEEETPLYPPKNKGTCPGTFHFTDALGTEQPRDGLHRSSFLTGASY